MCSEREFYPHALIHQDFQEDETSLVLGRFSFTFFLISFWYKMFAWHDLWYWFYSTSGKEIVLPWLFSSDNWISICDNTQPYCFFFFFLVKIISGTYSRFSNCSDDSIISGMILLTAFLLILGVLQGSFKCYDQSKICIDKSLIRMCFTVLFYLRMLPVFSSSKFSIFWSSRVPHGSYEEKKNVSIVVGFLIQILCTAPFIEVLP